METQIKYEEEVEGEETGGGEGWNGREEGKEGGRGSAWPGGSAEATHLSQY